MHRWSKTSTVFVTMLLLLVGATVASAAGPGDQSPIRLAGAAAPTQVFVRLMQNDVTIPAAWEGIWQFEWDVYDCDTEVLITSGAATDTLCAGDEPIDPDDDEIQIDCTGTADDSSIDVTCTGSFEFLPGCTGEVTYDFHATLDGDTYTANVTITTHYVGDCPVEDTCYYQESSGTRIGPAPDDCGQTPTSALSWGALKDMYR